MNDELNGRRDRARLCHAWTGEANRPLHLARPCPCGCDCRDAGPVAAGGVGYLTGSDAGGSGFTVWITDEDVYQRLAFALAYRDGRRLLSQLGRETSLRSCAAALVKAYGDGHAENDADSIDWADVDAAYAHARAGLGLDDDGPTVCPVCGSGDCIMVDDGIEPPKFCPNGNGGA